MNILALVKKSQQKKAIIKSAALVQLHKASKKAIF